MAILKNTIIDSTESIRLPVGTTAQRPGEPGQPTAAVGMIRYNTDDELVEVFDGTDWISIAGGGSDYTDISTIQAEATMVDIAYLAIPGGPRTLLNYVTSFGLDNNSSNDNSSSWQNGFDVQPLEFQLTGSYFNSGNLVMFNGDGSADGGDWVLMNFGNLGGGDFNPKWNNSESNWSFFGGEFANQSASNGGNTSLSTAYIWGFDGSDWKKLWQEPVATTGGTYGKNNSNWYNSGGTVTSGNGKYADYDNLTIQYVGFSVA